MAYTTIDDPSEYFHTQLYTGNGSSGLSITNNANAGDLQPDLLWISPRSNGDNNVIWDSSRTSAKRVKVNSSDAEDSDSTALVTFESDGFDLDTTDTNFNGSSRTYVAWQWKINGGTTASNTEGSETTTIQVNNTAGFSIVQYTGDASTSSSNNGGHGLDVAPDFVFLKCRGQSEAWFAWHEALGTSYYLNLDSTSAKISNNSHSWDGSIPSATTIPIRGSGTQVNGSGESYIAYCFSPIQGFSKFGYYDGDGSQDGAYVHLGFKPAFLMVKGFAGTDDWIMMDNKRSGYNSENEYLDANNNSAESDGGGNIDFLSNGFKIRSSFSSLNWSSGSSDGSYLYVAFAEHPFVTSTGVPCTAR